MSERQILDWLRQENSKLKSDVSTLDTTVYRVKEENERLKRELAEVRGESSRQSHHVPYSHYETFLGERPNFTDTAVNTSVTGDLQRQRIKASEDFNFRKAPTYSTEHQTTNYQPRGTLAGTNLGESMTQDLRAPVYGNSSYGSERQAASRREMDTLSETMKRGFHEPIYGVSADVFQGQPSRPIGTGRVSIIPANVSYPRQNMDD
jgi:hypothetical protein